MLKIMLIAACIGHIVCGITDCMLAYTPDGRFDMSKDTKDPERMKKLFSKMPLKQIELSMIAGVFSLFMAGTGYIALSRWAERWNGSTSDLTERKKLLRLCCISSKGRSPRRSPMRDCLYSARHCLCL